MLLSSAIFFLDRLFFFLLHSINVTDLAKSIPFGKIKHPLLHILVKYTVLIFNFARLALFLHLKKKQQQQTNKNTNDGEH